MNKNSLKLEQFNIHKIFPHNEELEYYVNNRPVIYYYDNEFICANCANYEIDTGTPKSAIEGYYQIEGEHKCSECTTILEPEYYDFDKENNAEIATIDEVNDFTEFMKGL